MPLLQQAKIDPIWLKFEVGPILSLGATEIGAQGTPSMSHGTKFLSPQNFSYFIILVKLVVLNRMHEILNNLSSYSDLDDYFQNADVTVTSENSLLLKLVNLIK